VLHTLIMTALGAVSEAGSSSHMKYYIARDVFCCETNGGLVFLDLLRNRYFGLEASHVDTLSSNVSNWTGRNSGSKPTPWVESPASIALLDRLVLKGILVNTDPGPRSPSGDTDEPQRSFYWDSHDRTRRIPPKQLCRFGAAVARVAVALRLRKFSAIVHRLASSKPSVPTDRLAEVELHVRFFALIHRRVRPWFYNSRNACVFDSLVLVEFLRSNGIATSLAIGVKTEPFAAHCWAQWGSLVLNNTVEEISPYSRILVV
jgi:hypothetical protein